MCRNLWSVPKNTVIFGFRRFQKSGRSSLILVVIVRYIHIGYRLKLGKNCTETIILMDFSRFSLNFQVKNGNLWNKFPSEIFRTFA